jgi:hypothetical protein
MIANRVRDRKSGCRLIKLIAEILMHDETEAKNERERRMNASGI